MKYRICISALLLWAGMQVSASNNQKEVVIKIIETSDVHGNFFPYNFIERKEWSGSLARVHSFVKEQREKYGDNCLLMDNGDILQGQPTAYYYNFYGYRVYPCGGGYDELYGMCGRQYG